MLTDTIVLGLNSVKYDNPNLKTQSPGIDIRTGEIGVHADMCGHRVQKAFLNTDKLQFDAKARKLYTGETAFIEAVKFSVPKVLGADVACLDLCPSDISDAIGIVENELADNGIIADAHDARLWRVDATVDILTAYPFEAYASVFSSFSYRNYVDADFGSTYRVGGKEKQFCIYDKIAEMKLRKADTDGMPENVMRFEFRNLKSRALRNAGFAQVGDLLENYGTMCAQTHQSWNKALFRLSDDITHAKPENCLELLTVAQKESVRWVGKAERLMGKLYMLENGITPKAYYRYLMASGASRQTATKYRDDLIGMQLSRVDAYPLYDELRTKVNDAFCG